MSFDHRPSLLLALICVSGVISMLSFALWPVFLVTLGSSWNLSNIEIGWIGGAYFIGYVLATPFLVGGTDRIDARSIYLGGCGSIIAGCIGFAIFATDFWSAFVCWGLVGAGLAGTYMPGLQILNARLTAAHRIRAVPFYTSCFGFGTGGSFLVMGHFLTHADHVTAAFAAAAAAAVAALLVLFLIAPCAPPLVHGDGRRHPLDLRPAFRKPRALGYITAYGAHTYELFAFRNWSFALFIFIGAQASPALSPSVIAVIVSLLTVSGMVASIIGAKFCLHFGRHRMITLFGLGTAMLGLLSAFSLTAPLWVTIGTLWLFNIAIMLDSGALTAGTVEASDEHDRGALLAVHSMVGFAGGAVGGPVIGWMLDMGGGVNNMDAWFGAVLVMGLGSAIVALIQWRFWRGGNS